MRRPAASALVLGLLSLLGASAGAAPVPPGPYRFSFEGDTLVSFDRAALPALPPKMEWALSAAGRAGSVSVEGSDPKRLRFVTRLSEGQPRGAKRTFTLAAEHVGGVGLPSAKVESGAGRAVVRTTLDDDAVWAPVAASHPDVYDRPLPRWVLSALPPTTRLSRTGVVSAKKGDRVVVRLSLVADHAEPVRLSVKLGTADAATVESPSAAGGAVATAELTAAADGLQGLSITNDGPRLPPTDDRDVSGGRGTVWIDSITIDAPADLRAGEDRLVLDEGVQVRLRSNEVGALPAPHPAAPDPVAAAKGAEMVILSTTDLFEGARRLAAHRTARGVRAVVVPVSDVWDFFGGNEGEDLLRAYFGRLETQGPPKYVLLCGDATHDRTDLAQHETIPTAFARTKYNGATASDRLLVLPRGAKSGGPVVGRLPFRDAKDLDAYVARVVAWEAKAPPDPTRRLLRFVTGEGRFGPQADRLIEMLFLGLVDQKIPRPYDVLATYASASSPYCWPPKEMNEHVISSLNAGSLCFTYVGHGWADGFDTLRVGNERYPILTSAHVPGIDIVAGTPPAMFVIACTTARFDEPGDDAVGELLLKRPRGPLAYFGATRICHPIHNSMLGRYLAEDLLVGDRTLGEVVQGAGDEAADPKRADAARKTIETQERLFLGPDEDFDRLYREGQAMYALLGDPALRLPLPRTDLLLDAAPTEEGLSVTVTGKDGTMVPDGTEVEWAVETARNSPPRDAEKPKDLFSPEGEAAMKRNWAKANDKALARGKAVAKDGKVVFAAALPEAWRKRIVHAKAWAVFGGDVHQGSATTPDRR